MTTIRESSADIDAAAARWAARVDRGPLSDKEQADLEAWAARDPRRAGAYAKALAISAHLDRAQGLSAAFSPSTHPVARAADRRRLLATGGILAAASVVGAVGYGAMSLRGRMTTSKGDIRRAPLSDGSAVTLNTATTIRAAFDGKMRRVDLLRGEALFDVAKDPARPFVVVAGDVRVRAVGTSFTVRAHADGEVGVIVREGVVEVWRGSQGKPVRLAAEHAIQVASLGALTPTVVGAAAVDRALAWRQGQIDLDGLTLGQAAEEFARYSDRRIVIDDPTVARLKMTGLFSASDPDGFAKAAAMSLGLTATPRADGVRLSRG
ncbi:MULTISPECIES: FecR domain-containing protein [Caulobacter]|uniref:Fe2+-dicitrate sensor, membrane component n=1 Tax=Caulobacter vibrioides OR37 TaxID=1292034 RepID=R0EJ57_CAUVI|nr:MULTISPECIES: FecR domain-containing protein [Caulobacter]ENZ82024.1 Fe2+-dicitrate sensor, membrane component [Caulobacter vibrioides OR37]MBQ1560961.1 FecR domain-containing protein [Caulobacter sp.]